MIFKRYRGDVNKINKKFLIYFSVKSESDDGQLRFDDDDLNDLSVDTDSVVNDVSNVDDNDATREEEREVVGQSALVRR